MPPVVAHSAPLARFSTEVAPRPPETEGLPQTGLMADLLRTQGVARVSTLLDQGWSRHGLAKAVTGGRLIRPRKGWVARPTADPELLLAVQHGVLLSCITQTKRLGLWLKEDQGRHLAVRHAGVPSRPPGSTLHWHTPLVPREPNALEDPLVNALDAVAHCQPFEEAVAIWDSALNKGLTDYEQLSLHPFRGVSRRVLQRVTPYSDSGLESHVRQRLRWLRVRITAQSWLYGHRVDFLIGRWLALQIDGSHHVGAQRTSDIEHDAVLMLHGYTVIRVSYSQVMGDWPEVQRRIMDAIAQGKHLRQAA